MTEACDLCRANALEKVYAPASSRGLSIYLCRHCGLVQSLPRIDRAPRRSANISGGVDWGNIRYGKGFRTDACLQIIRQRTDLTRRIELLDVGSNRGSFARAFLAAAPKAHLVAVEPDERVAASCVGFERCDSVEARIEVTNFPEERFDIVHSCHTIEHLASPAAVLADHWRVLKPGGLLVVDAPNIALIDGEDILEEWFIDKHLHHYSAVTLARLLDASGFEIIDGPDSNDRQNLLFAACKRPIAARPVARDPHEVERARARVIAYKDERERNLSALAAISKELQQLAPRRVALWGAGRLFDALVRHGGFDPSALALLVDTHLIQHMPERHGVPLSPPGALAAANPGIIVVMSRAFADEIGRLAAQVAPKAEIILYSDLLARARLQRAA